MGHAYDTDAQNTVVIATWCRNSALHRIAWGSGGPSGLFRLSPSGKHSGKALLNASREGGLDPCTGLAVRGP